MYFTKENEKYNRMSFLSLKTLPKQGTITTSAYCKPTFGEMFTHFDSFFLPSHYQIGVVHTFLHRCSQIC